MKYLLYLKRSNLNIFILIKIKIIIIINIILSNIIIIINHGKTTDITSLLPFFDNYFIIYL